MTPTLHHEGVRFKADYREMVNFCSDLHRSFQLLLQRFEQLDPVYDDVSLAALKRILRDRIAELEASVRLLSMIDAMPEMPANDENS